ncbi:hypothetical protein, partial [Burkholderia multivorans]|uniref:hypothetical protein n=1 Tax=Burkholderia multivorans TaxID=87883 RepID=UPI001C612AA5
RAFNHVGQNSMKTTASGGSVLRGHQHAKKWEDLTPRQKQRESLKMRRKIVPIKKKEMFVTVPLKAIDD